MNLVSKEKLEKEAWKFYLEIHYWSRFYYRSSITYITK